MSTLTLQAQVEEDSVTVNNLEEIIVSGFHPGTIISSSALLKTETITRAGLTKMNGFQYPSVLAPKY